MTAPLKSAGFAVRDITPVVGSEMPGMLLKRFGASIHDPLLVTAMVVHDGVRSVAVVGVDALSVKRSMVLRARRRIHEVTGLDEGAVMVAASHTHNGGATCEVFISEADPAYCERVSTAIAEAVIEAWQGRVEAQFRFGSGRQEGVAFNRRFRLQGGKEATHPGKGNTDIIEPAGPVDPEVGVIGAFAAASGRFLGCLVNYTCHCTVGVGGAGFSADYPYYLRQAVAAVMGAGGVTVFVNGACGDVTQVNNRTAPGQWEGGEPWGKLIGHCLAGEAIKVLSQPVAESDLAVGSALRVLNLEPRLIPESVLQAAAACLAGRTATSPWDGDAVFAREIMLLREMNRHEPTVPAEVQALRIGPACLVANPAEYFCRFGLEIKAQSKARYTYVVELANGCIGYVPGSEQVHKGEGYEPRTARSSKLSPAVGENLAATSIALVNSLLD